LNRRGQFSIIAALLVAIVIVSTVITTYTAIRYDVIPEQPQVLSAVDETNLAIRQLLAFTVGYYGSILQVTGNTSYAQSLARTYLQSGFKNIADMKPEWGSSFSVQGLELHIVWYLPTSFSHGQFNVTYNLAGLGFYGLNYASTSDLNVQILSSLGNKARICVSEENGVPLTVLSRNNFKFYRYLSSDQTWELDSSPTDPVVLSNGTYLIDIPSGIKPDGYLVQVEDTRGIMATASSFSRYNTTVNWNTGSSVGNYPDTLSNVDNSADIGTHSNFTAQRVADGIYNNLTEQLVFAGGYNTISFDSQSSYIGTSQATFALWQHPNTGSGSDRVLLVSVDTFNSGATPATVTGVTYNGVTLTQVATALYNSDPRVRAYVYMLVNPSAGTNKVIRANFSASTLAVAGAVVYTNVNQTVPVITSGNASGTSSSSSPSVSLTASGSYAKMLFGHVGTYRTQNSYTLSDSSGQTNRWSQTSQLHKGSGSDKSVTSGSVSMSWTLSKTASWAEIALLLQPTQSYVYELDLEEQWNNVSLANPYLQLCIKTGALAAEQLNVDVWSNNAWVNVVGGLTPNAWNNISISQYLSTTFTIKFRDANRANDAVQDSWLIDAALLSPQSDMGLMLANQSDSTIAVEWLQNGTMRVLGQNMQQTNSEMPIPPVPVKALHFSQTINGANSEVPFQTEDWASDYRVPLGLTNNVTVFSNRQMVVFLLNRSVTGFTLWWDGSDLANQTSLAYINTRFNDNPVTRTLNNGRISVQFGSSFNPVTTTVLGSGNTSTVNFMRINGEDSTYGSELAYVITNGVVRDVIQQEAEWSGGAGTANDCPNLYANIVLTLPAGTSFYTYQLRLMFVDSQRDRVLSEICPLRLTSSIGTIQTENGTVSNVVTGTGDFSNYLYGSGNWTAHHWSQFASGSSGAGIMFTDQSNTQLYAFDSFAGGQTGIIRTDTAGKTISLMPVALRQFSPFRNALDITWKGAIATYDSPSTPIYYLDAGKPAGLWILAEYQPLITVGPQT
jgi:hypothetical protein